MQFPASVPVCVLYLEVLRRGLAPRSRRAATMYHYVAWGPDVLVDVHASKFSDSLPTLDFVFGVGERHRLPLNVIVFFLGRLGWVEDGSLAVDLASGLSAATLASFEAWADSDGRLDWSPTSETGFLQRALTLAAELATGVLPAERPCHSGARTLARTLRSSAPICGCRAPQASRFCSKNSRTPQNVAAAAQRTSAMHQAMKAGIGASAPATTDKTHLHETRKSFYCRFQNW